MDGAHATATDPARRRVAAIGFATLWVLAILAYAGGDTLTTLAVVRSPGHLEANPVMAAAVARFGGAGAVALKLLAVIACGWVSVRYGLRDDDPLFACWPPALLVVMGTATSLANLGLLA